MATDLPDPALVVLVGVSGSGKTSWARQHFRTTEIVGSDALRAVVGSGEADLDASVEAFDLLERIVDARIRRGLCVVVDTLGFDADRRRRWLAAAHAAGLPAVVVLVRAAPEQCRRRNRDRDRPVPAPVLTTQFRRMGGIEDELAAEGWSEVVSVDGGSEATPDVELVRSGPVSGRGPRPEVVLQVSRFPWGEDPAGWLRAIALAADEVGIAGLALMDHLIQIPQVGRTWEPIPEPWVSLGLLAGLDTRLRLGTLVSPITFREPGITAKAAATLDTLSGGRAFLGLGAGWWEREHAAYGMPFPTPAERLDALERGIELIRGLWAPGTKAVDGRRVTLPESTCYPRPVEDLPIIVGGSGERTLRIVASQADGCNLPSRTEQLAAKITTLRRRCAEVGRDPADVMITVLDVPVIGTDREDVARRVERLRGRTSAPVFAAQHHAGTIADHVRRYRELAELGVETVFCALPDLRDPQDVRRLAPLVAALDHSG